MVALMDAQVGCFGAAGEGKQLRQKSAVGWFGRVVSAFFREPTYRQMLTSKFYGELVECVGPTTDLLIVAGEGNFVWSPEFSKILREKMDARNKLTVLIRDDAADVERKIEAIKEAQKSKGFDLRVYRYGRATPDERPPEVPNHFVIFGRRLFLEFWHALHASQPQKYGLRVENDIQLLDFCLDQARALIAHPTTVRVA